MKKILLLVLTALSFSVQAQTVKIAAAGSLKFVLNEIADKYKSINNKTEIKITTAATGTLFQQITNGADFDIFMAADKEFPDKLKEQGMTTGEVKTYAFGKLILWSNSVDVTKGVKILLDQSIKRIALANPKTAPYGDRAVECLKFYKIYDKVKGKIIYADNIAQAAQFTQTGNSEAGFLAMSLVTGPEMKGYCCQIDEKSYRPIEQAMVLIKKKTGNTEAVKFMNFVLSQQCKSIFEKYGFKVPRTCA
jgi:molybdate transport system substrate-binding protein